MPDGPEFSCGEHTTPYDPFFDSWIVCAHYTKAEREDFILGRLADPRKTPTPKGVQALTYSSQLIGLEAGLDQGQVNKAWFGIYHAEAAKRKIPYEQYKDLSVEQVKFGILNGLKREDVKELNQDKILNLYRLRRNNAHKCLLFWSTTPNPKVNPLKKLDKDLINKIIDCI